MLLCGKQSMRAQAFADSNHFQKQDDSVVSTLLFQARNRQDFCSRRISEAWNSIGSNELVMADNNNQGLLSTSLPLCHHQFIH
jgi:hypothetical protein